MNLISSIILFFILLLCTIQVYSAVSYTSNGRTYTLWTGTQGECPILTNDGSKLYQCLTKVPVLDQLPWIIKHVMQDTDPVYNHDFLLCRHQNNICRSILEYKDNLSPVCTQTFTGCQLALRHLHAMMFKTDGSPQQCNNFALKSIRGFFHDYLSSAIDGSLLSEMSIEMNVGLCKFSQYINTLSDHTRCDAGSIISMAGMLGYEACGIKIWELDQDVKPITTIGRGYTCVNNNNPNFIDSVTGQRKPQFNDIEVSADSKLMEEFWYLINGHNGQSFAPPDGEVEYSAEATGAAHVIGRVTCPVTGKVNNVDIHARPGFFAPGGQNSVLNQAGTDNYYKLSQAETYDRNTQCVYNAATNSYSTPPYSGLKADSYPSLGSYYTSTPEMTNLAPQGGFCGMPTQFLKTVSLGGFHRIPRFMSITDNLGHNWPNQQAAVTTLVNSQCTIHTPMFIPWELLTLSTRALPTSPALDAFLAIAWDGMGTINSAWDSCELTCDNPISLNRMCSGNAMTASPALSNYNFSGPAVPSTEPTYIPSKTPSSIPSKTPTVNPSSVPTRIPSYQPSKIPTKTPVTATKKPRR